MIVHPRALGNGQLRRLFEKPPPHALEAEMCLLGAMIVEPERIPAIRDTIHPSAFYSDHHTAIFRVMVELYDSNASVDIVQLNQELVDRGILEAVGGREYLVKLATTVPSAANASHYARLVTAKAATRGILSLGSDMIRRAHEDATDPLSIAADAEASLEGIVSCHASLKGGSRHETKWTPVPISELTGGAAVDWSWHGYLAAGHVTLLTGFWKAGKSTLLGYLLREMGTTGGNLGGATQHGRVLMISEESTTLWCRRRDELDLGDHVEPLLRPFGGLRPTREVWRQFINHVADLTNERHYNLVVFDTFAGMSPVENENDASEMLAALGPIHRICEAGPAVLLVHHPRKGDGSEGQASRGSGAFPGWVDIIVEMRRYEPQHRTDRRRVLTAYSRFDETPGEAVLELTDDGYVTCGTRADSSRGDRLDAIADQLPTEEPGLTADELHEQWADDDTPKPALRTLKRDLAYGHTNERWKRTGDGKRGRAFRFYSCRTYTYRATGNETGDGEPLAKLTDTP